MPYDPGAALPPGIGTDQQAQQATYFLRNQPWYQDWLRTQGVQTQGDPYGDVKLSDGQQQSLLGLARNKGIGISDRYTINENGQIAEDGGMSGWLKALLIGGGAAATLFGIPGLFPGFLTAGGGAAAGAGGAAAAGDGLLASTPIDAGLFTAPTLAASGAVPAALAGGAGAGAAAATAAASSAALPAWLSAAIKAGVPVTAALASRPGGFSGTTTSPGGANGLTPQQNDMLTQLIQLSLNRQQEAAPIHQAAMALAGNLAPTSSWSASPRFQQAVQQTTGPGPAAPMNPAVAAAVQALMRK